MRKKQSKLTIFLNKLLKIFSMSMLFSKRIKSLKKKKSQIKNNLTKNDKNDLQIF